MIAWADDLYEQTTAGHAIVLVTVIALRGSAPREVGTKMIVTASGCIGSIGGGQLEYECAQLAAGMLGGDDHLCRQKFPLGAEMDQCCGGVVEVLFESIATGCPSWLEDLRAIRAQGKTAVVATTLSGDKGSRVVIDPAAGQADPDLPDTGLSGQLALTARKLIESGSRSQFVDDVFLDVVSSTGLNIAVFGAGHVGTAVIATLSGLDAQIQWVDSRPGIFPTAPPGVQLIETDHPAGEVATMPGSGFYLVMTHSHKLDFEICQAILTRRDASYCGLIGSLSKRRQFEKRLRSNGLSQALIDQLICPIGIDGIRGKTPKEIAIAVAAEILQLYDRERFAIKSVVKTGADCIYV